MADSKILMEDLFELLRGSRLFSGLTAEEMQHVADSVELFSVNRGEPVCLQGAQNDALWLVYSGRLYQSAEIHEVDTFLGTLETGSYWGQDCLEGGRLNFDVHVLKPAVLVRISADKLAGLVDQYPLLRTTLQVLNHSEKMVSKIHADWLQPGEEVFFAGRKHPLFLFVKLFVPLGLAGLVFFLMLVFIESILASGWLLALSLLLILFLLGWAAWGALDWTNDFSIVTNMRVIWLERVALLYDSRHEAPLSTLQSVDVQTTQAGRIFGYGNIFVRTISGPLVLPDVENPEDVAELIYQQWQVSKAANRKGEIAKMEETLRSRLRNPRTPADRQPGSDDTLNAEVKPGVLQELFADFFKVRYEAGGVVTYRKHWYILLKKTWKAGLALAVVLTLWFSRLADLYTFIPMAETLLVLTFAFLGVLGWWAYSYADWRNDAYQITPDQIIDIERKPLGKEVKKVAQLENILSIEYKRIGLMGLFLNFGTVTAMAGTTPFDFEYVYNPSQVQHDLFTRMALREQKKKTDRINEERERVGDWIATYHQHQDEYDDAEG